METAVTFAAGDIALEGLLHRGTSDTGVVITHPHSLYGGDMYNPVVLCLCKLYAAKGYTTLRFNFRGVGASGGHFADGVGEAADVLGGADFLLRSGIDRIHLAGYSFGARVLAAVTEIPEGVVGQLHLAPPLAFMDYSDIGHIAKLRWVIAGENDEIAPPGLIKERLGRWNEKAQLEVVPGADHFFSTKMNSLERIVEETIG